MKTSITLSASALQHNFREAKRSALTARVSPVVKANAYGHGLEQVVSALRREDVPFFSIDSVEELERIRAVSPHIPVLLLGRIPDDQFARAIALDTAFVVSSIEHVRMLETLTLNTPARVHIELETGLYRFGADDTKLAELLAWLLAHPSLATVEGVCTHLSTAEDVASDVFVREQEACFRRGVERIELAGFHPLYRHVACSAALWLHPFTCFDVIRFGISLYGVWSSSEVAREMTHQRKDISLLPVLTWKTYVGEIKTVPRGATIGYGRTHVADHDMRIAVLPIGYADGFVRRLSSCGEVLIRGKRARVVGRVCMNICMVDVTTIHDVAYGDEVVIFGRQGEEVLGPEAWDDVSSSSLIVYEALACLRESIPRTLV